jgi:hypothetical protein
MDYKDGVNDSIAWANRSIARRTPIGATAFYEATSAANEARLIAHLNTIEKLASLLKIGILSPGDR